MGEASAIVETGNVSAASNELQAMVYEKFGWLSKHLPGLQKYLAEYTSEEAQQEYLQAVFHEGLIENNIDALDAARCFGVNVISLLVIDLCGMQIARLNPGATGTIDKAQAWTLKNMMDAVRHANKVATEMQAEAGFSKKSRWEMGNTKKNDLQEMLQRIMESDGVSENEDMTAFFGTGHLKPVEVQDGQADVFREDVESPLSAGEKAELLDNV